MRKNKIKILRAFFLVTVLLLGSVHAAVFAAQQSCDGVAYDDTKSRCQEIAPVARLWGDKNYVVPLPATGPQTFTPKVSCFDKSGAPTSCPTTPADVQAAASNGTTCLDVSGVTDQNAGYTSGKPISCGATPAAPGVGQTFNNSANCSLQCDYGYCIPDSSGSGYTCSATPALTPAPATPAAACAPGVPNCDMNYQPLEPLPAALGQGGGDSSTLVGFINYMFPILITLGAMTGVLFFTVYGIEYMISSVSNRKIVAKDHLISVLYGMTLLIASVLILSTINPELLNLNAFEAHLKNLVPGLTPGGKVDVSTGNSGSSAPTAATSQLYPDGLGNFTVPDSNSISYDECMARCRSIGGQNCCGGTNNGGSPAPTPAPVAPTSPAPQSWACRENGIMFSVADTQAHCAETCNGTCALETM